MRINEIAVNSINSFSSSSSVENPFDLDLKVTELRAGHHDKLPITSHVGCTPGCGQTGTGNSFCCTCK